MAFLIIWTRLLIDPCKCMFYRSFNENGNSFISLTFLVPVMEGVKMSIFTSNKIRVIVAAHRYNNQFLSSLSFCTTTKQSNQIKSSHEMIKS